MFFLPDCRQDPEGRGEQAFTLIELIVVMAVFALLSSLATINLLKPQYQAATSTGIATLAADLKKTQLDSMMGDVGGIYFGTDTYTIFDGTSYTPGAPENFEVKLGHNVALSNVLFPSNQIVFAKVSGEVLDYEEDSNSVTVQNTQTDLETTVTVNRYGVLEIN